MQGRPLTEARVLCLPRAAVLCSALLCCAVPAAAGCCAVLRMPPSDCAVECLRGWLSVTAGAGASHGRHAAAAHTAMAIHSPHKVSGWLDRLASHPEPRIHPPVRPEALCPACPVACCRSAVAILSSVPVAWNVCPAAFERVAIVATRRPWPAYSCPVLKLAMLPTSPRASKCAALAAVCVHRASAAELEVCN
jgi:hypothetical protein